MISNSPLRINLQALVRYDALEAEAQAKGDCVLLRRTYDTEGNAVLYPILRSEITWWDRLRFFFGSKGLLLESIVRVVQETFLSPELAQCTETESKAIERAVCSLNDRVSRYPEKHLEQIKFVFDRSHPGHEIELFANREVSFPEAPVLEDAFRVSKAMARVFNEIVSRYSLMPAQLKSTSYSVSREVLPFLKVYSYQRSGFFARKDNFFQGTQDLSKKMAFWRMNAIRHFLMNRAPFFSPMALLVARRACAFEMGVTILPIAKPVSDEIVLMRAQLCGCRIVAPFGTNRETTALKNVFEEKVLNQNLILPQGEIVSSVARNSSTLPSSSGVEAVEVIQQDDLFSEMDEDIKNRLDQLAFQKVQKLMRCDFETSAANLEVDVAKMSAEEKAYYYIQLVKKNFENAKDFGTRAYGVYDQLLVKIVGIERPSSSESFATLVRFLEKGPALKWFKTYLRRHLSTQEAQKNGITAEIEKIVREAVPIFFDSEPFAKGSSTIN